MRYYQHKQTGELLGSLHNLREYVQEGGNFDPSPKRTQVLTEVIRPNKLLGSGVIIELMNYPDINKHYKRISKKKALQICPDFGQMRHVDSLDNYSINRLASDFVELSPIRTFGCGIAFTKEGKYRKSIYQTIQN